MTSTSGIPNPGGVNPLVPGLPSTSTVGSSSSEVLYPIGMNSGTKTDTISVNFSTFTAIEPDPEPPKTEADKIKDGIKGIWGPGYTVTPAGGGKYDVTDKDGKPIGTITVPDLDSAITPVVVGPDGKEIEIGAEGDVIDPNGIPVKIVIDGSGKATILPIFPPAEDSPPPVIGRPVI